MMCENPPFAILHTVLVPEVGRDLRSLHGEGISALTSTAIQKLLHCIYVELEVSEKMVSNRFHIELIYTEML